MGGFSIELTLPPKYPESCVDGGVLEPQFFMVHHTSPRISWSGSQPTFGNSCLDDRLDIYINWSSSRQVFNHVGYVLYYLHKY
jgi:hypothetical protein